MSDDRFKGPGYFGYLTEPQQAALEAMKKDFASEIKTDEAARSEREAAAKAAAAEGKEYLISSFFKLDDRGFLRYLRACDFDTKAASDKLRKTLAFREEYALDQILLRPPHVQRTLQRFYLFNRSAVHVSKDGQPTYLAANNPIYYSCYPITWREEDQILVQSYLLEMALGVFPDRETRERKLEEPIRPMTASIFDVGAIGLQYRNVAHYLKPASAITEAHFPETLLKGYIINAPGLFAGIWSFIKGFLDPVVAGKFQIETPSNTPAALLDVFGSQAELPAEYGGEKKGIFHDRPDEKTAFNALTQVIADMKATPLVVAASASAVVEHTVDGKAATTVQWFYRLESYDVSVSIAFESKEGQTEVVRPSHKLDSTKFCVAWGNYSVPEGKAGTLRITFDNTGSWMRSKSLTTTIRSRAFSSGLGDVMGCYKPWQWWY